MRSLTAGWEIKSELAARPKLPSRTTARKTAISSVWIDIRKSYDHHEEISLYRPRAPRSTMEP